MRQANLLLLFAISLVLALTGCGGGGTETLGVYIIADHTSLNIEDIPPATLDTARALHMSLDHASVGGNILGGMNVLATSDATRYAFPNWGWRDRGNPSSQEKVDQFVTWVTDHEDEYDVFQMKFCYIDQNASFTHYRDHMLDLEEAYPDKTFIWWTMPIKTIHDSNTDDRAARNAFNVLVRNYCAANNKILFDIADIQSHDASGNPVVDGEGHEVMDDAWCSDWSSGGAHLTSAGGQRVAKGMWWLMSRLTGWSP